MNIAHLIVGIFIAWLLWPKKKKTGVLLFIIPTICFGQHFKSKTPARLNNSHQDTSYFGYKMYVDSIGFGGNPTIVKIGNYVFGRKLKFDTSLFQIKNDSLIFKKTEYGLINYQEFNTPWAPENPERKAWIQFLIGVFVGTCVTITVIKIGNK